MIRFILMGFAICAFSASSYAVDLFFKALHDVPLMQNLHEMPETSVSFDTESGQIISVDAFSNVDTEHNVSKFYQKILPQFGWGLYEPDVFIRGQEKLSMRYTQQDHLLVVSFTLEPL